MNAILTRDILLNMLLGLVAVVVITLASLNPKASPSDAAAAPGNVAVMARWDEGPYDIDLWVRAPGDRPVGYSNRGGKVFNLLRDDLGLAGDSTPFNTEDAFSRGIPDGEYVVNVHAYKAAVLPIVVHVEVRIAEPGAAPLLVLSEKVELAREGQEKTVARFRVKNGMVVPGSVNNVFVPLRSGNK